MFGIIELLPIDSRKSFYGKCSVLVTGDTFKLKSYYTIVAEYNKATRELKVRGMYSPTTTRHIKSFVYYLGLGDLSTKEIKERFLLTE